MNSDDLRSRMDNYFAWSDAMWDDSKSERINTAMRDKLDKLIGLYKPESTYDAFAFSQQDAMFLKELRIQAS